MLTTFFAGIKLKLIHHFLFFPGTKKIHSSVF